MKKIKKFHLNQSHFLSSSEMAMLTGGDPIVTSCGSGDAGAPCIYYEGGVKYTGSCVSYSVNSSDNNGNHSEYHHYCQKN